jgi:formate hydrogenlyase subunit 3/multisubunit Na+/H+ antiporter MnhD subunit
MGKKFFWVFMATAFGALAFAAGGDPLAQSGTTAGETVTNTANAYKWVFALIPIGVGILAANHKYNTVKREEEEGRTHPSAAKYGGVFLYFVLGVVVAFITYGVLGMVFAGKGFTETWNDLVVNFWKNII